MRPPPERPSLRGSSVWTQEEDTVLLEKYHEFRRGGRLQGYALFVASALPRKTEKQVRDRVRTLRAHGLITDETQVQEEEPRPPEVQVEAVVEPTPLVEGLAQDVPVVAPPPTLEERVEVDLGDVDRGADVSVVAAAQPDRVDPLVDDAPPPVPASEREQLLEFLRGIGPVCDIGMRLRALVERGEETVDTISDVIEELTARLLSLEETEPGRERRNRQVQPGDGRRSRRTRWRVSRFAKTQELFKKNPSRLAELALKDQLGDLLESRERVDPPREGLVGLYRDLWGQPAGCTIPPSANVPLPDGEVSFLTVGEVRKRLARLKPGGAPGPEGVTKPLLLRSPHIVGTLTLLYNILLFRQLYPRSWKKSRTIFIPKRGRDLARPENWRPITIAPLLARIYSGLLESRLLKCVTLSARQSGFRPGPGCYTNCTILGELLRLGKRSRLVGVLLDVKKAFDTVSHSAIDAALGQQGVPLLLRSAVQELYAGATTSLANFGLDVAIKRGVKQGDPLSPLLFNLVLDPILVRLSEGGDGFRVGTADIAVTAYADDLVLFSSSVEGLQRQLAIVDQSLGSVGMSLSVEKCIGFAVERRGDAWVAPPVAVSLGTSPIRFVGVSEPFQYLGVTYTLARGFSNDHHLRTLEETVARVGRLALKPHQKSQLLMQYVVPTCAYRITVDLPSQASLRRVDAVVRREVKRYLHLGPYTTDCLLYARKRDGGLGFPNLSTTIRLCALRAGLRLFESSDVLLRELVRVAGLERRLFTLASQLGLEWPTSASAITSQKILWKAGVMRDWVEQPSQGMGVAHFWDDPVGNCWLLDQGILRPGQFIDALKLRTNTHGTRVAIRRADRGAQVMCRRCTSKPETLGHVIGECTAGRRSRIARHNEAVGRIAEVLAEKPGTVVAREQVFSLEDGTRLRPDLVIQSSGSVWVVDVTVPFENQNSLQGAALEKVRKYQPLLPTVQEQLGATRGEVIPVVLGARGALPKSTSTALRRMGILDQRFSRSLSLLALRTSIDIVRQHLDYG